MPEAKREVVWREGREHEADVVTVGETRFVVHEGRARTARAEHEWDVDIDDPQSVIRVLRSSRGRVDLFTFAQRLPHVVPRFDYIKEWDNVAAVRISTFNEWWTRPIKAVLMRPAPEASDVGKRS